MKTIMEENRRTLEYLEVGQMLNIALGKMYRTEAKVHCKINIASQEAVDFDMGLSTIVKDFERAYGDSEFYEVSSDVLKIKHSQIAEHIIDKVGEYNLK